MTRHSLKAGFLSVIGSLCLFSPAMAGAEDTVFGLSKAPQPGPEHKKMGLFTGTVKMTGEAKDSPSAPAHRVDWSFEGRWLPGGFHVELRHAVTAKGQDFSSVEVLGYDAVRKTYVSRFFRSDGMNADASATLVGTTYVINWTGHTADGKTMKGRNTVVFSADWTSLTIKSEIDQDGKWWTSFEGKGTRSGPALR